jgi:hypothetical protein
MYGIDTAAEARKMAEDQRDNLAKALLREQTPTIQTLSQMENQVHFWQGVADLYTGYEARVEALRKNEITGARAAYAKLHFIASRLQRGPDDTWSGRGNDDRRSYWDGITDAAGELMTVVDREADNAFVEGGLEDAGVE